MKKKSLQTGFGGIYDKGENLVAAQWAMDSNVRSTIQLPSSFSRVATSIYYHFLMQGELILPHKIFICFSCTQQFRLLYLRRVNLNRVHVSTDLHVDENLNSQVRRVSYRPLDYLPFFAESVEPALFGCL
jgi:hypothetical protein